MSMDIPRDFDMYWTSVSSIPQCYNYVVGPISAGILRVALETKMTDAQVDYERVDLQSYEARNGAYLAFNFSFPSMYIAETGSQMASEIISKLSCAARSAMVPQDTKLN